MLIEIHSERYTKIKRQEALTLLDAAAIPPDKITMHRDSTITARYARHRHLEFLYLRYEHRLEDLDNRVVILKRPNTKLDRGRYLVLRFALAASDVLQAALATSKDAVGDLPEAIPINETTTVVLSRLNDVSRDMRQLTQYAHDLANNSLTDKHLLMTLDELRQQIHSLSSNLRELEQLHGSIRR